MYTKGYDQDFDISSAVNIYVPIKTIFHYAYKLFILANAGLLHHTM